MFFNFEGEGGALFEQGTLTEVEGSVQLTSLYLDNLRLILKTLFTFLQNKLP